MLNVDAQEIFLLRHFINSTTRLPLADGITEVFIAKSDGSEDHVNIIAVMSSSIDNSYLNSYQHVDFKTSSRYVISIAIAH